MIETAFINIRNGGQVACPFTATLNAKGPVVNPRLVNAITGEFLQLNRTMAAGERVTIQITHDLTYVTSTIDGDIRGDLELESTLSSMAVGDNLIKTEADTGASPTLWQASTYRSKRWRSSHASSVTSPDLTTYHEIRANSYQTEEWFNDVGKFTLVVPPTPYNISHSGQGRDPLSHAGESGDGGHARVSGHLAGPDHGQRVHDELAVEQTRDCATPAVDSTVESGLYGAIASNLRGLPNVETAGLQTLSEAYSAILSGGQLLDELHPDPRRCRAGTADELRHVDDASTCSKSTRVPTSRQVPTR